MQHAMQHFREQPESQNSRNSRTKKMTSEMASVTYIWYDDFVCNTFFYVFSYILVNTGEWAANI